MAFSNFWLGQCCVADMSSRTLRGKLIRLASRGQCKLFHKSNLIPLSTVSAMYSERVKRGHVRLWPKERCVPEVLSGRPITPNMLCAGDTRGLDDACKVRKLPLLFKSTLMSLLDLIFFLFLSLFCLLNSIHRGTPVVRSSAKTTRG